MPEPPEISTRTLAEAEKLLRIRLTQEERTLALEALPLALKLYEQRREIELPNDLGPAVRFDPRLPGTELPTESRPLVRSAADPGPLPEDEAAIAFAPVTRLSRWIERGAITSSRLTEIYLGRLKRIGPKLECVLALTEPRARAEAARADAELAAGRYRGPLHGIPWGAKDLLDTEAIPTTWGASPYRDRVPGRDAEVVRLLGAAGAVLVAKLSLGELALGDVWFGGDTRSPWKLERGSGGSSAGSAAGVAAGLAGFALGTETLGSITNPSMTCGVAGLRPSFGRVPRTGAMALCWSFDKIGPICRTAEDTALVLAAICGRHDGDPDSIEVPFNFDATEPVRGRRVGFVPSQFEEASAEERGALDALRTAGAELTEVTLPELPFASVFALVWVEATAAFQELTLTDRDDELRKQDADSWPNIFRSSHFISAVEYVQMQRLRRRFMEVMRACFRDVDAIAAPGMGHTLCLATNATGHPSLTLRVGFREDDTPATVTLHGRLFDEGVLCRIGMALEAELGVWDRRPKLD